MQCRFLATDGPVEAPLYTAPVLRAWPFILATGVSAAVVTSAPYIGGIRSQLRQAFPGQFVFIVGAAIGLSVLAAVVAALWRIRERRVLRYALIAIALVAAALYSSSSSIGNAESDAVERFHFVEYGLVTFLFYRAWRPLDDGAVLVLPILAGLLVGTCDEWMQWFVPVRIGEMRDVFLNVAAIACGLLFSLGLEPPHAFTMRLHPRSRRVVALFAAAVTIVFALFVQSVHLGYSLEAPGIGAFRSRYTIEDLEALSADRVIRWAASPPLVLKRMSREDQYMSEGVLHVQERNRMWSAGNVTAAWRENQILETFYAPVLDTPSYVSRTGHRWPAAQRADAEARAGADSSAYVSNADRGFIRTWPRWRFWSAVGLVLVVILASSRGSWVVGRRS